MSQKVFQNNDAEKNSYADASIRLGRCTTQRPEVGK